MPCRSRRRPPSPPRSQRRDARQRRLWRVVSAIRSLLDRERPREPYRPSQGTRPRGAPRARSRSRRRGRRRAAAGGRGRPRRPGVAQPEGSTPSTPWPSPLDEDRRRASSRAGARSQAACAGRGARQHERRHARRQRRRRRGDALARGPLPHSGSTPKFSAARRSNGAKTYSGGDRGRRRARLATARRGRRRRVPGERRVLARRRGVDRRAEDADRLARAVALPSRRGWPSAARAARRCPRARSAPRRDRAHERRAEVAGDEQPEQVVGADGTGTRRPPRAHDACGSARGAGA